MVILTSRLFDVTYSPSVIDENPAGSDLHNTSRRLNRVQTLDEGAVIDDLGYADGDRSIKVVIAGPSIATTTALQGLMEADGIQRIATRDGVFEGGISQIVFGRGEVSFRFLVETKLSA